MSDGLPSRPPLLPKQLRKPLGMVLEEDATGRITVAEVVPEGNADKSQEVGVGDELVGCSGVAKTTEQVWWVPEAAAALTQQERGDWRWLTKR